MTYIRLDRLVARTSSRCAFCTWESVAYDSVYEPTIGGVALARYCSARCCERGARERGMGAVSA